MFQLKLIPLISVFLTLNSFLLELPPTTTIWHVCCP